MKKILLVDDSFYIRKSVGATLQNNGYQVVTAHTWNITLIKSVSCYPDLIIMDLIMPEDNGLDICFSIKCDPETSHIPIIIASAHITSTVINHMHNCGINDYISKPYTPELLLKKIKKLT